MEGIMAHNQIYSTKEYHQEGGREDRHIPRNSFTTVIWNQRNIFKVDYDRLTTGSLNTHQRFGAEITSVISNNKLNCGCMASHSTKRF